MSSLCVGESQRSSCARVIERGNSQQPQVVAAAVANLDSRGQADVLDETLINVTEL